MLRKIVSYWTVLGLAFESGRLEQSMNVKLVKMGTAAERAAQLEADADRHATLGAENEKKAATDIAEQETLEEEAAAHALKSEQAAGLAAEDQAAADELAAQAAGEQDEAVAHFTNAAADEGLAEKEFAQATAEAADASKTAATAHGEEVGTGICELIPFMDIVCDVIGGTAAVGLEVDAASQAAESAAGFAASAAARADEESELAIAGEFQAKAAQDAEVVAEMQAEAAALETEAEEEAAQAEEDETLAEEKLGQSDMEQEAAEEEEAKATEEQAQSASSWEESMVHGLGACWDLIMAGSIATVALGFFAFRIMMSHVLPGASTFFSDYAPSVTNIRGVHRSGPMQVLSNVKSTLPMKQISYVFLHCFIFLVTAGIFGDLLSLMEGYKVRGRGGVLLLFAAAAGVFQGLLLHAVPHLVALLQNGSIESSPNSSTRALGVAVQVFVTFVRSVVWLLPLFSLEVLILWVNFGHEIFSSTLKSSLCTWYIWLIFAFATAMHFMLFEIQSCGEEVPFSDVEEEKRVLTIEKESSPLMTNAKESSGKVVLSYRSNDIVEEDWSSVSSDEALQCGYVKSTFETECENDTEQGSRKERTRHAMGPVAPPSLLEDLEKLRLPFEVLIISCMIALLRNCIPNAWRLWPVFKSMIVASHPRWFLPLLSIGIATAVCLILWLLLCVRGQTSRSLVAAIE